MDGSLSLRRRGCAEVLAAFALAVVSPDLAARPLQEVVP
jgi:hypothetical protein